MKRIALLLASLLAAAGCSSATGPSPEEAARAKAALEAASESGPSARMAGN